MKDEALVTPFCKLCKAATSVFHSPQNSMVGLEVSICGKCGFIQGNRSNLPLENTVGSSDERDYLSCDADYAPFRVGKRQMLGHQSKVLEWIREILRAEPRIYDGAAARGDFALFALDYFRPREIVLREFQSEMLLNLEELSLIHPTVRVVEASGPVQFEAASFDFVYSTHSLEHFENPGSEMQNLAALVGENGLLMVDVPDLESVNLDWLVEDYFYDQHLSYFCANSLERLAAQQGLVPVYLEREAGSLIMVFSKRSNLRGVHSAFAPNAMLLAKTYSLNLESNRAAVGNRAIHVEEFLKKRRVDGPVVAVGCGRRFDAFIRYGLLPLNSFDYFVDNFLCLATPTIRGVELFSIENLPIASGVVPSFVTFSTGSRTSVNALLAQLFPSSEVLNA